MSGISGRNTVLVIDDDPDFRGLVAAVAEICGVAVLQADNCRNGMRVLEREEKCIKMVLLDYYMPGMEPTECAACLVAKTGADIPVILVTAAADPAARAAELRLTRWLSKPFDCSDLETLLTCA